MVFLDANGKYYQADAKKAIGDCFFVFPPDDWCKVLTEVPMSREELFEAIRQVNMPPDPMTRVATVEVADEQVAQVIQ